MKIADILSEFYQDQQWSISNNDYATLDWLETNPTPKPSLAEIEAKEAEFLQFQTDRENYKTALQSGYTVQPEGFTLKLDEKDRQAFTSMLLLVKEGLDLSLIDNNTIQTITDNSGITQSITTLRFRQIMVGYGMYYKSLWDNLP